MKLHHSLAVVLLFGSLSLFSANAAVIFANDDFERTMLSPWLALGSGGVSAFSTTEAYTGSQSYQLNNAGASGSLRGIALNSGASFSTAYYRFYFYIGSTTPGATPGNMTLAQIIGTGDAGFAAEVGLNSSGDLYFGYNATTGNGASSPSKNVNNTFDTTVAPTLNAWNYVELEYVQSASGGGAELFLNNSVTPIAASGFNQDTSAYAASWFRLILSEATTSGTPTANVYFDDVAAATTQIGTLPVPEPPAKGLALSALVCLVGMHPGLKRRLRI